MHGDTLPRKLTQSSKVAYMNTAEINRHMVATGLYAPIFNGRGPSGDERWSRMILNVLDMRYAEAYGMVNHKNDNTPSMFDGRRIPHRRHF